MVEPAQVFRRSRPRSFALLSSENTTAASFEHDASGNVKLLVESADQLESAGDYDLVGFSYGCLGLISVQDDVFLCLASEAVKVTDIDGHHIFRINKVTFYSLTRPDFDDTDPFGEKERGPGSLAGGLGGEDLGPQVSHPCAYLSKLLSSGTFFYSHTLDITRSFQQRCQQISDSSIFDTADSHFVWNHFLLKPVLEFRKDGLRAKQRQRFDTSKLFLVAIQGFVGSFDMKYGVPIRLGVISRLSCKRTGTRFNARGIDDDGYVSNFVETEQYVCLGDSTFSFVQIRGSVPVFWEQNGIQVPQRIEMSRSPDAVLAPFLKHMEELKRRYGKVHVINLLSKKDGSGEAQLSDAFRLNISKAEERKFRVLYTGFDYHAIVKGNNFDKAATILDVVQPTIEEFGYFSLSEGSIASTQKGILRTNCLDCLDRTNVIQNILSRYFVSTVFAIYHETTLLEDEFFVNSYNGLWADNADWLSRIYAGTGAIKSSLTRKGKQTMLGFLDDAAKSVNRFYINNFQDKSRQEAIDVLLGKVKYVEVTVFTNVKKDELNLNLESRAAEFRTKSKIRIFLGTWNVNGRLPNAETSQPWLSTAFADKPHLIFLGIQELIELTAGQIVTADTEKLRTLWEAHFIRQISTFKKPYVLIRSLHLVALGLFAFARSDCIASIRNIETSIVKTGLGGMAGNKGGIGLSLRYGDTSCVFVTAHLAAGEKAVEERNRDYATIHNSLSFKGKKIWDHDNVFWFGDFNYRIDLNNDEVRYRINNDDLEYLVQHDQLYNEKAKGLTFQDLKEGRIRFAPTYKYDNGTDIYDTSEKARVPSWTDRILWSGTGAKLLDYSRAECMMSDHRPVRATFQLEVTEVDAEKREIVLQEIVRSKTDEAADNFVQAIRYEQSSTYKPPRPASGALLIDVTDPLNPTLDMSSFDFQSSTSAISTNNVILPAASTALNKWWDEPIDETWIPNEGSEVNPFYRFM